MKIADKYKLIFFISISLILSLTGCVDTGVQNLPQTVDYQSQLKIANLAALSNVTAISFYNDHKVRLDSASIAIGDQYPAEGQPFATLPSGSDSVNIYFANGTSTFTKITLDTELKLRLYLLNPDAATTSLVRTTLRYTWQEKGSSHGTGLYFPDSASIAFFNGTTGNDITKVLVSGGGVDTTIEFAGALGIGSSERVNLKAPVNYTISLIGVASDGASDSTFATVNLNAAGSGRYTTVMYGQTGSLAGKVYTDD